MLDNSKILMVNHHCDMIGGIERYMIDMTRLLKKHSSTVIGLFAQKSDSSADFANEFDAIHMLTPNTPLRDQLKQIKSDGFNTVIIHKIKDYHVLENIIDIFPNSIAIIHDHDYYCMRSHKYFPYKRINCNYPFNLLRCSICSGMIKKTTSLSFNSPFMYKKQLAVLRNVKKIVVLSEYMKNNMLSNSFSQSQIQKIYPVIKLPSKAQYKSTINNHGMNILFAGQIIRGKGLDLLINAIKQIKSNSTLRIVGRGNDESLIKTLISELNLDNKVDFKGFSHNIDEDYNWADVVIVPSRWQEPFGLVGVEAFARKLPVIGFDIGGISEWLHNNENGYLIEPGNINKMAEAIDILSENSELRKKFGKNGYDFVKRNCNEKLFIKAFK